MTSVQWHKSVIIVVQYSIQADCSIQLDLICICENANVNVWATAAAAAIPLCKQAMWGGGGGSVGSVPCHTA